MAYSQSNSPAEGDPQFRATHDQLTGLLNREGLGENLQQLIQEKPGQFGIILIDLDGVKKVNDTEGHASGDELLVRASGVFQETVRQSREKGEKDIVARGRSQEARIGGDEFVLLFPGAASEEDMQVIEKRLRKNLDEAGVSASIGGQVHQADMDATSILALADLAMYKEKEQRKLERYAPEQLEVIEHIGSLATLHEIDPRDLPTVLSAIHKSE